MIVNFNTFKEFEVPLLRLCNADDSYVCNINHPTEFKGEYNFSEFSVISFRIDYMTDRYCYDNIAVKKEIYLGKSKEDQKKEAGLPVQDFEESSEDCGYFVITDVAETKNLTERYKTITAKSCEFELSGIEMPYIGENDGFNTFGSRVLFHELDFAKDIDEFPGYTPDNAPCVMRTIIDYIPGWIVKADSDFIDPSADKATLSTRTFETDDKDTIYGFLMSNAAEAFNCVFLFDVFNRIIYIKSQRDAISGTDIYLSSDDFLESITIKESEEDRINAVQVSGSDAVSISSVNPLGNNYIYKFNDKYDRSVMSPALWSIVSDWCDKYETDVSTYTQYMKQIYSLNAQISTLSTVRMSLDNKKNIASSEKTQTDAMLTYSPEMETKKAEELGYYTAIINEYDRQVSALDSKIGNINDSTNSTLYGRYNSYNSLVDNIIQGLDFYNYIYNHPSVNENENTAAKLYTELVRLFRVYSYSNTNIVMSDAVKNIPMVEQFEAVGRYDYENDTSSTISQKVTTYANGFNTWINTTVVNWVTNTVEPQVDKQFDVIQELYDDAIGILSRTSQPRCEITIDSTNFIFSEEFKHKAEQIKTGCSIHIEKPNGEIVKHYVLKINVDYSGKDFSITLSNRYRLNDALSIFEDSYGNTSSISAITNSHSIILEEQKRKIDALDVARLQSLNYTKQHILSADNQDIFVDDTGMIVRTVTSVDENGVKTYDPYQFKLANGSILFTEDSWQTAGLAVGKYYDPRIGSWRMGINGQHIMANTIEASSLTVGSTSNTSGTNLLMDGSFDGDILGQLDSVGTSAWVITNSAGEDNPQRLKNIRLIYGNGANDYTEAYTPYVRLGIGSSMRKTSQRINIKSSDSEIHFCMFLNGQVKVDTVIRGTNSYLDETYGRILSYINEDDSSHKCVELFSIKPTFDGYITVDITISYDNDQNTGKNYAEISGIYISDKVINYCNADIQLSSRKDYGINPCHTFSTFPNRHWKLRTVDTTGIKDATLNVEYDSSGKSNGLCFNKSQNYLLICNNSFSLEKGYGFNYQLAVSGTSGSSMLINSYFVTSTLYNTLTNNQSINLQSVLDSSSTGVLKKISTYIDLKNNIEYENNPFDTSGAAISNAYLVCIISTNVETNKKIYLNSVVIKHGMENSPVKELRDNLWCSTAEETFAGFAYEFLKYETSGGFDDGSYIAMPPGVGLRQREKFVVFEGLPYYVSCYIKGHFDMSVMFYSTKNSNNPISTSEYSFVTDTTKWTRVSCDVPIIAPTGAKYANVILNATEDEDYVGCRIDGSMLEQSTTLNAYCCNNYEAYAKYTTIDSNGICVKNGAIKIYDGNNELALHADSSGNLEMIGKITSSSGKIGGWAINSNSLSSNGNNAVISANDGSFTSKASNDTKTTISGGSIQFFDSSNSQSGKIYSESSNGSLAINALGSISFSSSQGNLNSSGDIIMSLSDKIYCNKKIANGRFYGSIQVDDYVYADDVYVDGYNVGLAKDIVRVQDNLDDAVSTLNSRINGIESSLSSIVSELRAAIQEVATAAQTSVNTGSTQPPSSSDADSGSTEASSNESHISMGSSEWNALRIKMTNRTGYDGGYSNDYFKYGSYTYCANIAGAYRSIYGSPVTNSAGSVDYDATYRKWNAA